jgi:hypothetical protein
MSHPYIEFGRDSPLPEVGNFTLMISSIVEEPYSIVPSIVAHRPTVPNLTYVPEIDGAMEDEQVLYYFLIAFVLIVLVILTFIKTSPQGKSSHLYHTVPHQTSEILVLEEEDELEALP